MKLSRVDKVAIQSFDDEYLYKKGVSFFFDEDYEVALEYFHLAISMGNVKSLAYVGNCYMFGRGVPEELDLGLSYYKVAIEYEDVDATYRLGKLYDNGLGVEKDTELAMYYYKKALDFLENESYEEWLKYPELFYIMANEMQPGGRMMEDIKSSYEYLLISKEGYEIAIRDGAFYLEKEFNKVLEQINNNLYDNIKESIEKAFNEKYSG